MLYEDLKAGDVVYMSQIISTGWGKEEVFFLPRTVTKVTKTQFIIKLKTREENRDIEFRFKRENGQEYGSYSRGYTNKVAFPLGFKRPYGGQTVRDDTVEYNRLVDKIGLVNKAIKLQKENVPNLEWTSSKLSELITLLTKE